MRRLILRFFAVIGFFFSLLIALCIGAGYYLQERSEPEPDALMLALDFSEPIAETSQPSPFDIALHEQVTPLFDIIRAVDRAKDDPHVKGIVAKFGSTQPSLTQAQEIRAALAQFRAKGKFTYAFGSSYGDFGTGNRAYYLASAFENIWLQPVGAVGLTALAVEMPFAKPALDKIGVSADFMQREEYKSAMDNVTRDSFAPQVRAEMQGMLEDLSTQLATGIGESRKLDGDHVKELMAAGPYTDEEAMKAGLVTHLGYADEMKKELDDKAGKDTPHVNAEDYLAYERKEAQPKAHIALITGAGMIVDKAEGSADLPGESAMGADKIAGAFDDAADAKDVDAILFRIDSPGGSPEASETIRRALVHAQKSGKPVIVSMGEVAASGGYWVAMNADDIVADPGTLTGSIGVLGGKFVLAGLMQKVGVNWETVKTNENAGMWNMNEEFSPAQRARFNALLDQTYAVFTKNVSEARKIPIDKMPEIAKGRVWTGNQAVKIGLIDELGGYDTALAALRKKLNLGPDDLVAIEQFPAPESPVEKAFKLMKNFGVESAMLRPILSGWQKMAVAFGPLFRSASMKPVELRMPEGLDKGVR